MGEVYLAGGTGQPPAQVAMAPVPLVPPPASPPVSSSPSPGDTWREPTTGMKFVWVPGGCFQVGSNFGGGRREAGA